MFPHRWRALPLDASPDGGRLVRRRDRSDELIRVGRMPRLDSFRIGVEVLPRQIEEALGGNRRPAS